MILAHDQRLDQLPELNAIVGSSDEDLVYFPDVIMSDMGKLQEMASKASLTGYMTPEDYRQFRILAFEMEWFNKVSFKDGR